MMGMSNLTNKTLSNTPQSHESRRHILSFAADALKSVRKKRQSAQFGSIKRHSLWMDPSPPKAAEEASVSGNNKKGSISLDQGGKFVLDL